MHAIADPVEITDPAYGEALKQAVGSAVQFALEAVTCTEETAPPLPTTLLAQARLAARNRVDLDTVLRRYFAGYTLFGDFLVQEAEDEEGLAGVELKHLLRTQAAIFDRLVVAVSEEYGREARQTRPTREQRRARQIERLLAGEPLETSDLGYEIEAHHLGLIAVGEGAEGAIADAAARLDCRLLTLTREDRIVWGWLGCRRPLEPIDVRDTLRLAAPGLHAALGEPAQGLAGWRLSHRQALAALPIAAQGEERVVRYADVALLACALADDLLVTSLRRLYLDPLGTDRDGGQTLRETLQAYFRSGRNSASTAAALGITRQTVHNRLRAIEERVGHSVNDRAADLEVALHLGI